MLLFFHNDKIHHRLYSSILNCHVVVIYWWFGNGTSLYQHCASHTHHGSQYDLEMMWKLNTDAYQSRRLSLCRRWEDWLKISLLPHLHAVLNV